MPDTSMYRPTLLIGFGAFGLDALRRLLSSAAPRGVLRWTEPGGGSLPGDRSLEDLSLLWVPDRWDLAGQQIDEESVLEGSSFEMMRDLYRQIEQVEPRETPEIDLAAAMVDAVERLLSASSRALQANGSPLGLDVFVLARPTGPEVIGILDRMMTLGMRRLANNANLTRAVQGAEALSYTAIYDFKNYWDRSAESRSVRRALFNSTERWQKARQAGQVAFGRLYLVDGRTRDGIRDARHRIDEICLFLEFLLFEGQRGALQRLYQSAGSHESPVATFGVRLMEKSTGLLSRLAAARFAIGWLDYMANGSETELDAEPQALRRRLEPYRPVLLDGLLGADELEASLSATIDSLETDLLALESEDPDWPSRVQELYQNRVGTLKAELARRASERLAGIAEDRLGSLDEDLRKGVDADLRDERRPVPLGSVLRELDEMLLLLGATGEEAEAAEVPEAPGSTFERLKDNHRRYLRFKHQQLDAEGNRGQWWPLLALVLGAGLTFPSIDLLESIPDPDPTRFLWVKARQALRFFTNPLGVGAFLVACVYSLGYWGLAPRLAGRVERARMFYEHPERGRIVDWIRSALRPEGSARAPLEHYLARLLQIGASSVRSEVSRAVGRMAERLRRRRREMEWLRRQMREFLTLQGLSFEGRHHELHRRDLAARGIRHTVESTEDFEQILSSNPPVTERFRSMQASRNPFAQWSSQLSDAFLYPIDFIEDLSKCYRDPFVEELARAEKGPEQKERARELLGFLRDRGGFDLAFSLKAQEGVPVDRRLCLLPAPWRRLPGVLPELSDLRIPEEEVVIGRDPARAYLLRTQIGIDPKCLLEEQP